MVHLINNSPRVMNDAVEADIIVSRPAQSLVCSLRSAFVDLSMECKFDFLVPKYVGCL